MDMVKKQIEKGVEQTIGIARLLLEDKAGGPEIQDQLRRLEAVVLNYAKDQLEYEASAAALSCMYEKSEQQGDGDNVLQSFEEKKRENAEKAVRPEKHDFVKQFIKLREEKDREAGHGAAHGGDGNDDDDELEMVQVSENLICPVSKREMVMPMKHVPCGHVYDKDSIEALMKQSKGACFCPQIGCAFKGPIQRSQLKVDEQLLKLIKSRV